MTTSGRPAGPAQVNLGAKQAVEHPVYPPSAAESEPAQYPFAAEPGLLQRPLLGDVANLRGGLDPVDQGVREQVGRQQPVRLRAVSPATRLRRQAMPISQQ